MIFVDGIRNAALERNSGKLRRARQSHFNVAGAVRFHERQFVAGERSHLAQFFCDDAGDVADGSRAFVAGIPVSGDGVAEVEAFDSVREVAHEVAAAQFAVGENFEAEFLLLREHAEDVLILEGV